jgi:hypothetical protein
MASVSQVRGDAGGGNRLTNLRVRASARPPLSHPGRSEAKIRDRRASSDDLQDENVSKISGSPVPAPSLKGVFFLKIYFGLFFAQHTTILISRTNKPHGIQEKIKGGEAGNRQNKTSSLYLPCAAGRPVAFCSGNLRNRRPLYPLCLYSRHRFSFRVL